MKYVEFVDGCVPLTTTYFDFWYEALRIRKGQTTTRPDALLGMVQTTLMLLCNYGYENMATGDARCW